MLHLTPTLGCCAQLAGHLSHGRDAPVPEVAALSARRVGVHCSHLHTRPPQLQRPVACARPNLKQRPHSTQDLQSLPAPPDS